MQRPLPHLGIIIPGRAREKAGPVVGRVLRPAVPPDVVVVIGALPVPAGGLEPGVLVGGVVHHQVHDQLHAPPVRLRQQPLQILHGAELGVHGPVVADVVAVVIHGAGVNGREPERGHPQLLQIGQLFQDALEVAHSVAVRIPEAARVNLVEHILFKGGAAHTGGRLHRRGRGVDQGQQRVRKPLAHEAPAQAAGPADGEAGHYGVGHPALAFAHLHQELVQHVVAHRVPPELPQGACGGQFFHLASTSAFRLYSSTAPRRNTSAAGGSEPLSTQKRKLFAPLRRVDAKFRGIFCAKCA